MCSDFVIIFKTTGTHMAHKEMCEGPNSKSMDCIETLHTKGEFNVNSLEIISHIKCEVFFFCEKQVKLPSA